MFIKRSWYIDLVIFKCNYTFYNYNFERIKMNKKAGGIISLVGALFAVFGSAVTGCVGAFDSAGSEVFKGKADNSILWMTLVAIIGSIALIILSVMLMNTNNRNIAIATIGASLVTAVGGGGIVAIFMVLCLAGGIIGFLDLNKNFKKK